MASVTWTTEQQQVIDTRGRNLLVSAAAGSGKTAVLVERIIQMVTDPDHPVDIDRLLVMTFTNAAAAEMRERIGEALEQRLEANPGDRNLERQTTLIHHAKITTIDSF
ncbi:MAG: UvrD-helicase domain-containing protein, partial [Lachnospiraceae bacterium]|nr:UvrD-helicase domain-containing protein [Lachnospiraceae bacterium]